MNTAPWNISLPTALSVGGEEKPIRTDYRVALDCFLAINDNELNDYNKAMELLETLYCEKIEPAGWKEAIENALWYLDGGEGQRGKNWRSTQPLVSWEQDFTLIASAISAKLGTDIRGIEMHWWTFLAHYYNIGDCMFAQIVRIRDMRANGKKLDKSDREFEKRNKELIEIKKPLITVDEDFLKEWM